MAGKHLPVMPVETLENWFKGADGIYIDGTFGRGGHSRLLLERLAPQGKLLAIDRDPEAIAEAKLLQEKYANLHVEHAEIAGMSSVVNRYGWQGKVSGILLDLGVSSPQLDNAERGFSFMKNGPLDMRMDPTSGVSAAKWLAETEVGDMATVLRVFGEEKFAMRIARAIESYRAKAEIKTTYDLVNIIEDAVPARDQGKHKATRTFQAIRIAINSELEQVERFLNACLELLMPGGRLAVISFHSLEDRIVKRFMRDKARGDDLPSKLPIRDSELNRLIKIIVKAQRAGNEEVKENSRSRSAILRVAEKL